MFKGMLVLSLSSIPALIGIWLLLSPPFMARAAIWGLAGASFALTFLFGWIAGRNIVRWRRR